MSDLLDSPDGATPLESGEQDGLIPSWVSTREELNQVEQENIAEAMLWAFGRPWSIDNFDQAWLKGLHRRMFSKVWKWAGRYRRSDTNIGVPWYQITSQTENLLLDLHTQTADPAQLPWPSDELAVRFHHRLVLVHLFPNGNGRHARLGADLVLAALGDTRFSWGAGYQLAEPGPVRLEYLEALREADATGRYERLLAFAKS